MLFSPHDGSREEPVCQGKACLIPAISIILLRKMSMEDACDIELLRKSLVDLRVHGTLLTGTLGRTSPDVLAIVQTPPPPPYFRVQVPHFRVRPLLQVRLLPTGTPAHSGPPMFRISPLVQVHLRHIGSSVCAIESMYVTTSASCSAGNVRVSPPPVDRFLGIRARKRPTDVELSDCFRVAAGSLIDRMVLG